MGIDRLTKAANAAGYAMANSEDLLEPVPAPKSPGWRSPERAVPAPKAAIEPAPAPSAIRDWWFALSGKATA